MRRGLVWWVPPALFSALIFFLSAQSTVPVPVPPFPGADKVGHFGIYFVLGWLLAHACARTALSPRWAVAIGLVYGATDEIHQSFVPGRSPEFGDWVADAAGVIVAVILYQRWRARRRGSAHGQPASEPPASSRAA